MSDGLLHDNVHKDTGRRIKSTPIRPLVEQIDQATGRKCPVGPDRDKIAIPYQRKQPDLIDCPCCGAANRASAYFAAPSVIRGLIVEAIDKLGIYNQRQIADMLGWKRSTVRALLWYRRHVAKGKPMAVMP
jgi:hypothetical protein